ncbi:MAG: hypothetical protein IEMM0002_0611 [bacterium]|nr:MAG: hypothetical protein IEMM0002_0611 [bacterium]
MVVDTGRNRNKHSGVFVISSILIAVAALSVFVPSAFAEKSVYAGMEFFDWREYGGGSQLLEETGQRYVIGYERLTEGNLGLLLGYDARIYGNAVDYDGQTQSGVPITSKTDYFGWIIEPSAHFRTQPKWTGVYRLDYIFNLGIDHWTRDLKSTATAKGYKEIYTVIYFRIGAEAALPSKKGFHGGGGIKLPIDVYEKAFLSSAGFSRDPILKPAGGLSFYGTLGYRFMGRFNLSAYYESYRFNASPSVTAIYLPDATMRFIKQPESIQQNYGIKLSFYF